MEQMTDWTQTVNTHGAEFSLNATGTHVTVSTIHGKYTESIVMIERKLSSPNLLPAVRSMFKSMKQYYDQNKGDKK